MKRVSVLDVRRSYTNEKARTDLVSHLWLYLVLRPLSFYLTPFFINLGLSANATTVLGLLPLISGLAFILLGAVTPFNFIIGAVLVNIWYLFDCIDGNIARFRCQSSRFGALLDFTVGLIYHTFFPVCVGIGLYLIAPTHSMVALGLECSGECWLIVGIVWSFASLFRRTVSLRSQRAVGKRSKKQKKPRVTIGVVLPRAIISFQLPLFLVATLVGALDIFLLAYAFHSLTSLPVTIIQSLRIALLVDRQHNEGRLVGDYEA